MERGCSNRGCGGPGLSGNVTSAAGGLARRSPPTLWLPPGARPLPALPGSLDVARFALGGSQDFLGYVTAAMLGLPIAERQPPSAAALVADNAAPTANAAVEPTLVALSSTTSDGWYPHNNLSLLIMNAFLTLFFVFLITTCVGHYCAGNEMWKAEHAFYNNAGQSTRPSGLTPAQVAEKNQNLVDYYNSQVLKERQQVLREALAEQPDRAAEVRWKEQRWPRLPKDMAPMPPSASDTEWQNIKPP